MTEDDELIKRTVFELEPAQRIAIVCDSHRSAGIRWSHAMEWFERRNEMTAGRLRRSIERLRDKAELRFYSVADDPCRFTSVRHATRIVILHECVDVRPIRDQERWKEAERYLSMRRQSERQQASE